MTDSTYDSKINLQDTRYAFATAKVRAAETGLLNTEKLDRMIDAASNEEALKTVIDCRYEPSESYEAMLSRELEKTYEFLYAIAPDKELIRIFMAENDYHNLKVLLKLEFTGGRKAGVIPPFIGNGTIPAEKLELLYREKKLSEMPSKLRAALEKAEAAFIATRDPQAIDAVLDDAAFEEMKTKAAASGLKLLEKIVEESTDLVNIRTFLRIKRISSSRDTFTKLFVPGGKLKISFFLDLLAGPLDAFLKELSPSGYNTVCVPGIEAYTATGTLTLFEKLSDDRILDLTRGAKFLSMGPETLVAYLYAKKSEIKNIRTIMVGRNNNIPPETIRERMRATYV